MGKVGPLAVKPDKVFHELFVKNFRQEKILIVKVDELLLNRAVEPFIVWIHFRCFGIGMPVDLMLSFDLEIEIFRKFTPVVGENILETVGKDGAHTIEKFFGGQ